MLPGRCAGVRQPAAEVVFGFGFGQGFAIVRLAHTLLNPFDKEQTFEKVFQFEVIRQLVDGFEDLGFGHGEIMAGVGC